MTDLARARAWLAQATRISVLTGAGISAESGIPTFRGPGGYWRNFKPEDLATSAAFTRDPRLVWEWYEERRHAIAQAQPNPAHHALAQLERRAPHFTLVTQNVDGLHDRAGSSRILKLHGDIWTLRCTACQSLWSDLRVPLPQLPPRCACGGLARPGVVWFGESLPEGILEEASAAVAASHVFLVIGTSARVYPAAGLVPHAAASGARVIEINTGATDFTSQVECSLRGPAGTLLPQLLP